MDENQLPPLTDDLWKKSNINKLENEIAFLNRQIEDLKIQVHHKDIFIARYMDNRFDNILNYTEAYHAGITSRVKYKLNKYRRYLMLALVSFIAGMTLMYII